MSTTESGPVMVVADDNKDLVTAQLASAVWWNGYQQLPLSGAVSHFDYDYPVSYDNTSSCDDNSAPFYSLPMMDTSANHWPISVQPAADEEELYVSATPMPSVMEHHPYKYPTTQAAVDYAMLECYAAVADPAAVVTQTPWTSVPYTDTTPSVSGYELCCSAPMPAVTMDYCNSLQMMQYGAAFSGYSMPVNQLTTQVDHTSFDKTASTFIFLNNIVCISIGNRLRKI